MGPAAGTLGGEVTAVGTPDELAQNKKSLTGSYLSGKAGIPMPRILRKADGYLNLADATSNNLQNVSVSIPLKVMVGISGVSGSGKSTLVMQELVPAVHALLAGKKAPRVKNYTATISGGESLESMVVIDQSPIGRTPRSNPATYLGILDEIRRLFAGLPESNARGYNVGRFSFNVPAGRCAECNGDGTITVEMHFLPEVVMVCRVCKGRRYNAETLQIRYKEKNIADVLDMTALEALEFFKHHRRLAQRIKLVNELAKRGSNTLYILDEPTTGLHTHDIEKLLAVLNTLVNKGNSMVIIEHNLDVLKTMDYLIDMGPEGGDEGGEIVAHGVPRKVAQSHKSHTGRYLAALMREDK
jgi:excinuclease ABC subunit A